MGWFSKKPQEYNTKEGYKQHYNPKSLDARSNGFSPVHRDVASQKIGRPIGEDEVVHHIDGNKQNNKPKNLKVMTKQEHYEIHNKPRKGNKKV
jgi:hypothetical protein